jgi:hypothetical protein
MYLIGDIRIEYIDLFVNIEMNFDKVQFRLKLEVKFEGVERSHGSKKGLVVHELDQTDHHYGKVEV